MNARMITYHPLALFARFLNVAVQENNWARYIHGKRTYTMCTRKTFGNEDVSHINAGAIKTILDAAMPITSSNMLKAAVIVVTRVALLVYGDPTRPENTTCYLPSKKSSAALVHGESGWDVQPTTRAVVQMMGRTIDLIFDHQPLSNVNRYGALLRAIRDIEGRFALVETCMRPVLVRNKTLLQRALNVQADPVSL